MAVIPRPEPMLRGENGRGIPLPRHGPGLGLPPHHQSGVWVPPPAPPAWGPSAPTPLRPGARAPPSPFCLRPWRPLAPPPAGFGISGLPEFPLPRPRPGSGAFDPRPASSGSSGARAPPRPGPARRLRGDAGGSRPPPRRQRQRLAQGPGRVLGRGPRGCRASTPELGAPHLGVRSDSVGGGRRRCSPPKGGL